VFLFSSAFAPLSLFQRMEEAALLPFPFPPLGSVGVAAVYAALALTRQSVIVTGLDFGYPEGRTHARGTPTHVAMLSTSRRGQPVGQAAYAAVRERSVAVETDKRGHPLLTDAIMRSYRDQMRRVGAGAARILDAGTTGLPFGAEAITAGELSRLLAAAPRPSQRLRARGGPRERPALRSFLDAEGRLLEEADALIRRLLSAETPGLTAGESALLSSVDHCYAHFPDQPDLAAPSPSFLARSLVAVRYYSRRLERSRQSVAD
jgi:hypothetical protein